MFSLACAEIARIVGIETSVLQEEEIDEEGIRIWSDLRPDIGEYLMNQDGSFLHLAPGEDLGPGIVKYFMVRRSATPPAGSARHTP